MALLDNLQKEVENNKAVTASAVALIQGIAGKLAEAGTDATKLAALQVELHNSSDALAAAVTANTPASNTPETGGGDESEAKA